MATPGARPGDRRPEAVQSGDRGSADVAPADSGPIRPEWLASFHNLAIQLGKTISIFRVRIPVSILTAL